MARLMLLRTWQVVPWLGLVEVDVADGRRGEAAVHGLPSEVAGDELFVRREEAGSARAAPGRRRTRSAWERDGEKDRRIQAKLLTCSAWERDRKSVV